MTSQQADNIIRLLTTIDAHLLWALLYLFIIGAVVCFRDFRKNKP